MTWMRWTLILATTQLSACDVVFSLAAPSSEDAAVTVDACAPGPFGSPVRLAEIAVPATQPMLRGDLRELLFVTSTAGEGQQIVRGTRATPDAPFENLEPLLEVNSNADDLDPVLTGDGLTLLFVSNRQTVIRAFEMQRPNPSAQFSGLRRADGINMTSVQSLAISRDGLTVYFENGAELLAAQRGTLTSPFGTPFIVGPIAPSPAISGDELDLYYNGSGGIMHARRAARGEVFGPGTLLIPGGADPSITADDHAMVFVTMEGVFEQRRQCGSSGA